MCNGSCIVGASCCPGEVSYNGCSCGDSKVCSRAGAWSECDGGNPDPKCVAGDIKECGDKCGATVCTAECEWTPCQGEGECMPGEMGCSMDGQMTLMCTPACFWSVVGGKCG
jgi:hypothetical protein